MRHKNTIVCNEGTNRAERFECSYTVLDCEKKCKIPHGLIGFPDSVTQRASNSKFQKKNQFLEREREREGERERESRDFEITLTTQKKSYHFVFLLSNLQQQKKKEK